jgi:hypothetical protein
MPSFIDAGPKLGQLINANAGAQVVDELRPLLRAIDALTFCSVINATATVPPTSPVNGDAYLLLGSPTGVWVGHQFQIAVWSTEITTTGTDTKVPGWDFYAPGAGWLVWDVAISEFYVYDAGTWTLFSGSTIYSVTLAPSAAGNFTVAHGLGTAPKSVSFEMTSGGQFWFQTTPYDSTNLYLVASDAGITGTAKCFT